jgi:hypothetical protein
MSPAAAIQWVSRRDRAMVAGALAGIVVLAWTYILLGAGMDTAMNMAMGDVMMPMPWTLTTFRVMLVIWIVMMTAMMLPSAAPMILLFATINRRRSGTSTPYATGLFALAYLSLWAAFSLAATCAQWELEHARLLSATMATASTSLAVVKRGSKYRHVRPKEFLQFKPWRVNKRKEEEFSRHLPSRAATAHAAQAIHISQKIFGLNPLGSDDSPLFLRFHKR